MRGTIGKGMALAEYQDIKSLLSVQEIVLRIMCNVQSFQGVGEAKHYDRSTLTAPLSYVR